MIVPAGIEELDAAWIDAALREGGLVDGRVGSIVVDPLGAAVGLLGDLARVRVTYHSGTGPATLIVKFPAADPGGHAVGRMLNAWAREVAFYREIAPASPGANVPQAFHLGADEAAERWVVVLEDCPGDDVDVRTGASDAQAAAAVDALAHFHGTWWESEAIPPWMPDGSGVGRLQDAWLGAHPRFLERFGHLLPAPTADWLVRFAPTLADWGTKIGAEPRTIVHADYRLDNLIFSGDRVTMIDWQTALKGPGAMDLSCFLATSLTLDDRRRLEPELIDRYLQRLREQDVAVDPSWFSQSYDENLLWWMGQFAHNLSHLEPADEATQRDLDLMVTRTFTAALDRDAGRLLRG